MITTHRSKKLAIISILVSFSFVLACGSLAQTAPPSNSAAKNSAVSAIEFDVVSVKRNKSGENRMSHAFPANGDSMTFTNVPLTVMFFYVYNADRPGKLAGLPDWTRTERYDITAKVTGANVGVYQTLDSTQRKIMLEGVLGDRFKLQIHREKRLSPVYELVVARSGSRMQPAQASEIPANGRTVFFTGPGQLAGRGATTEDLSIALSDSPGMDRQIVDKTGLSGRYSFTLRFTMNQSADGPAGMPQGVTADDSAPSIFAALQEQLGLKLEPAKAPVDLLLIDHVERPSEN